MLQSLRAELASERRLKREAEKSCEESKKEIDQLTTKMTDLEQKFKSTLKSSGKNGIVAGEKKRIDDLEAKVTELNEHIGRSETERIRLKTEFDQQKNLYDKVLDDVAAKIVVYMKQQEVKEIYIKIFMKQQEAKEIFIKIKNSRL